MMGFEQVNRMSLLRATFGLFLSVCLPASASFATDGAKSGDADEDRAKTLLARAVDRYRTVGDRALAEFSRQGEYVNRELYVYVLGLDGTLLASGGSSASLIGRNVAAMSDVTGKPIIHEMMAIAQSKGRGQIDYDWPNPVTKRTESKRTRFELVDGYIVAVGYYMK